MKAPQEKATGDNNPENADEAEAGSDDGFRGLIPEGCTNLQAAKDSALLKFFFLFFGLLNCQEFFAEQHKTKNQESNKI